MHFASLSAIVTFDPATGRVLRRRPAELADHLIAYRDVVYWREAEAVHAAKAKGRPVRIHKMPCRATLTS